MFCCFIGFVLMMFAVAIIIPWSIGEAIVKNLDKIMKVVGYTVLYTVTLPICVAMFAGQAAGVMWNKLGQSVLLTSS